MKNLKQVQGFLNNIPNINSGGCGIAALAIYRWLKQNNQLTKDTKFVYYYFSEDRSEISYNHYLNNSNVLENNNGEPEACAHAGIYYRRKYLDSNGKIDTWKFEHDHYVNEKFIVNSINNLGCWNSSFERSHIGEIEDRLNIKLNDIYN